MWMTLALVNFACGNFVTAAILTVVSLAAQISEHREEEREWMEERSRRMAV